MMAFYYKKIKFWFKKLNFCAKFHFIKKSCLNLCLLLAHLALCGFKNLQKKVKITKYKFTPPNTPKH